MCKGKEPHHCNPGAPRTHPAAPLSAGEGLGPREGVTPAWWPQFFLLLLPCCFYSLNDLQNHCCFFGKSMSLPLLPLWWCWFGVWFFKSIFCTVTHVRHAHNCCVALPCLTNLSSNLLFFFFLFMLPNKETNSSEESECDDLDPNTSMEVETIILVVSHPTPLP